MRTEKHQCEATVRQYGYPRLCQITATVLTQDYKGDDRWYCKKHASYQAETKRLAQARKFRAREVVTYQNKGGKR